MGYEKKIERKARGTLPYITQLRLDSRNVLIRIIREKYGVEFLVSKVTPDNEINFEQEIRKMIENSIVDIRKKSI